MRTRIGSAACQCLRCSHPRGFCVLHKIRHLVSHFAPKVASLFHFDQAPVQRNREEISRNPPSDLADMSEVVGLYIMDTVRSSSHNRHDRVSCLVNRDRLSSSHTSR
jgi:hypothetical protein